MQIGGRMKTEILRALDRIKNAQINLQAKAARESLAIEIAEELELAINWSYKPEYEESLKKDLGPNPYKTMTKSCKFHSDKSLDLGDYDVL